MAETTPLEKVPVDFDPNESLGVFNPTKEDFTVLYGGTGVTLKSGERKIWPTPKANHVAKHLAQKIVSQKHVELLQEKFEGLDTEGREKWKVNSQILYTANDIEKVKACLLFPYEQGIPEKLEVPETKFDKAIEMEKASKEKIGKNYKSKKEQSED